MDLLLQSLQSVQKQAEKTVRPQDYPVLLTRKSYALNISKTKYVSVGLRSHAGFQPVIVINGNKNDWVLLDESEWVMLLKQQGILSHYFYTPNVHSPKCVDIGSKTIVFHRIDQTKVISLRGDEGDEVCLGVESVAELWRLAQIVEFRIELLKDLNFYPFYAEVVKGVASIPGDWKVNIESVLLPLKTAKLENAVCMLEMLRYCDHIVKADVEIEQFGVGQGYSAIGEA